MKGSSKLCIVQLRQIATSRPISTGWLFEDICDANRIPSHRSKDSFLPARNAPATLARYDSLVTDVKCYIVAIYFDTCSRRVRLTRSVAP